MSRIVFVAAMIASVLALAKHEHALDRTGMFGSCAALDPPRRLKAVAGSSAGPAS